MHRYNENAVSQILSGYLREYRYKPRMRIGYLENTDNSKGTAQVDKYRTIVAELETWEREVVYPLANQYVSVDLDDGVKINCNKLPNALRKVAGLPEW